MKKVRDYGKNLGKWLHKSKMPTGMKVGVTGAVKRISKSRIKKMKTPKGVI